MNGDDYRSRGIEEGEEQNCSCFPEVIKQGCQLTLRWKKGVKIEEGEEMDNRQLREKRMN